MYKRIISRLDIKNNTLVKGVNLEGLRVLGDPREFILSYYRENIDEIFLQDVVASLYNRNQLDKIIQDIVKNVFVTISVGGGLRNISDINKVLNLGADKISINSAAIKNPSFLKTSVEVFGSSTITVNIETLKVNGKYMVLIESGREKTRYELFDWIDKIQQLGAGEAVVTSISYEGKGAGFDLELYKLLKKKLNIPLVAHGGAGSVEDIINLFKETDVDGVLISSLLHYSYIKKTSANNAGNTIFQKEFIKGKKISILDIKNELDKNNISVRK